MIDQARAGAADAFCQLVRQNHAQVRAYVARFVRPKDVVDDVAQEVFVSAHRSLANFRGDAPFRSWLLGIARRRVGDYLRIEISRRSVEERNVWEQLAMVQAGRLDAGEGQPAEHSQELAALQSCLGNLSQENAALVNAFYFESRSAGDIAQRLGKTGGSIRISLLRIRRALRACMKKRLALSEAR